jgi:hypothetical protein
VDGILFSPSMHIEAVVCNFCIPRVIVLHRPSEVRRPLFSPESSTPSFVVSFTHLGFWFSSPTDLDVSHVPGLPDDIEEADLGSSATRPVWPPQARCVATANGWIVAVVECGPPPNATAMPPPAPASSSASSSSHVSGVGGGVPGAGGGAIVQQQPPSKLGLVALIPPLRLVSRWNVRRGTTLGSDVAALVPLPPPVRATADADATAGVVVSAGSAGDPNFGRVAHAFVDPTGCHVLLSARNGEAYYLHSTSKTATKLGGFGPGADGSYAGSRAGATLAEATVGGGEAAAVQTGLTPGSYVTAVGWDR